MIILPQPGIDQGIPLERVIFERYSLRRFSNKSLALHQISNLLWAAGGKSRRRRTIPSAGATYPLEFYLITGENCVETLEGGIYLYEWEQHALKLKKGGDFRKELAVASLGQEFIIQAPASILISAKYERTTSHYGHRGIRYVHMEAGHACQNIHLEAGSLGLGTVVVGAFDDEELKAIVGIEEAPLALMPVGYPR